MVSVTVSIDTTALTEKLSPDKMNQAKQKGMK